MNVSRFVGEDLLSRCVCADCWGTLVAHIEGAGLEVHCAACGQGDGFISRHSIDKLKAENANQYLMAKQSLKEVVPWMFPKSKTPDQLLKELGF